MMEELFWTVLEHLQSLNPKFGPSGRYSGLPRRFKQAIHAVDSTTIALVANCMDWAKHRRRKAAAKMHCSFMSGFDLSLSKAGGRIALYCRASCFVQFEELKLRTHECLDLFFEWSGYLIEA